MAQSTIVTLDMDATEVQASSIAVLEHLMTFPPKYASTEYNNGVGILFQSLRSSLGIEEPEVYENLNV